jgi:hypothetical protein
VEVRQDGGRYNNNNNKNYNYNNNNTATFRPVNIISLLAAKLTTTISTLEYAILNVAICVD